MSANTMLKFLYKTYNLGQNSSVLMPFASIFVCLCIKTLWTSKYKNEATVTLNLDVKVK